MIKYSDFYNYLYKYNMITSIWWYELELIKEEMDFNNKEDVYLTLLSMYFSLVCSGNVCMSLDPNVLKEKWNTLVDEAEILAKEKNDYDKKEFDEIRKASTQAISNISIFRTLDFKRIFLIDNDYIYLKKYKEAKDGISKSINRLFNCSFNCEKIVTDSDIEKYCKLKLADAQKDVVKKGFNNNIIVTGGPGTGKTTSVLFLLSFLLKEKIDYNIYLAASSGKAASRMKESINRDLQHIDLTDGAMISIVDRIKGVIGTDQTFEEFTIHRLLGTEFEDNRFKYNQNNQFDTNSIFIIDEASMIDICLFNSLLNAIPTGARVFILGDNDQLPSVEVGEVYANLVSNYGKTNVLGNKIVKLVESKRFASNSAIGKLSNDINDGIEQKPNFVNDLSIFAIKPYIENTYNIDYYLNNENSKQKDNIKTICEIWARHFYKDKKAQELCTEIDVTNKMKLDEIFCLIEESKILCAENDSIRGVKQINQLIKDVSIKKKDQGGEELLSINKQYPGQIMMINKNNKGLDLYNGDSGVLVSKDKIIYFMVKKNSKIIKNSGYRKDDIFKIDFSNECFVFYPLRLISLDEIDLAYAISIHKSQGSDYKQVLIILPVTKGHPLLNRQILYTAITRSKGNTYILSNTDSINEAIATKLTRDTNISL